jgi:hypothetical protein
LNCQRKPVLVFEDKIAVIYARLQKRKRTGKIRGGQVIQDGNENCNTKYF